MYTALLKRIANRAPRLEVLLKALEALEALEPKIYNVFLGGIRIIFYWQFKN